MTAALQLTGGFELERALAELPRGTSVGVARRVLKRQLMPVAAMANAFWPGAEDDVFEVTSRIAGGQMSDSDALRGPGVVNMFVGAAGGPNGAPHAHLVEWGTGPRYTKAGAYRGSVAPQPMLTPAWAARRPALLRDVGEDMFEQIAKTVARRAARAKR